MFLSRLSTRSYLLHSTLLREQFENAARRLLNQLQALGVVRELDVRELNLLLPVLKTERSGDLGLGTKQTAKFADRCRDGDSIPLSGTGETLTCLVKISMIDDDAELRTKSVTERRAAVPGS